MVSAAAPPTLPLRGRRLRVAVLGAGWAGLSAAVQSREDGHDVTVLEMSRQPGGRARSVESGGQMLDNGQHILIGAYAETLRMMRTVGVDVDANLLRTPLCLTDARGTGLRLRPGPPVPAFVAAVLGHAHWRWSEKLALLGAAARWALRGFRCEESTSVASLTHHLPARLRAELIDPLCVAALNTPAAEASGTVFLRVLRDALFSGRGASDLLLPRRDLGTCFPAPAVDWLMRHGASLQFGHRVERLEPADAGWRVDGQTFDRVVLATSPVEAARLVQRIAPDWAAIASALRYEPIVTVYVHGEGANLPAPMIALTEGAGAPLQFAFDRGALGGPTGVLAGVISGAAPWVDRGIEAIEQAALAQLQRELGPSLHAPLHVMTTITEKRATFRCTPALRRPSARVAPALWAAGDHVAGPYPATLEGAVRSGVAAARSLDQGID